MITAAIKQISASSAHKLIDLFPQTIAGVLGAATFKSTGDYTSAIATYIALSSGYRNEILPIFTNILNENPKLLDQMVEDPQINYFARLVTGGGVGFAYYYFEDPNDPVKSEHSIRLGQAIDDPPITLPESTVDSIPLKEEEPSPASVKEEKPYVFKKSLLKKIKKNAMEQEMKEYKEDKAKILSKDVILRKSVNFDIQCDEVKSLVKSIY